jgi:secernin
VTPGILGMELVRLGLERADTASDAVEVMTELVERYGQYGAGTAGQPRPDAAYDNSYLVADAEQVWALETTGRRWVAKAVDSPYWALSNEATIRTSYDRAASDLEEHARVQGWHRGPGPVDFAAAFSDPQVPLQVSHIRLQRSRQLLGDALKAGPVGFAEAARVLADHYEDTFLDGPKFNPARPDFHTLCMHEHPAGFTWGNTASSVIAVLPATGRPYLWWAATTPCTSVYLPVAVTDPLPEALSVAGTMHGAGPSPEQVPPDRYSDGSYWWAFQALLEAVAGDDGSSYHARQPRVRDRFDRLQRSWLSEVEQAVADDAAHWQHLTARCTEQALRAVRELEAEFADG